MSDNPLVDLLDEVVRLRTRLQSLFSEAVTASNLSSMQSLVLTSVIESKTPPTVPRIGRSLGYPRQTVQRATNALLDSGLIETAPNPDHKRAHLLRATEAGQRSYELSRTRAAEAEQDVLTLVDAGECQRVASDLKKIRSTIEHHLRARKEALG